MDAWRGVLLGFNGDTLKDMTSATELSVAVLRIRRVIAAQEPLSRRTPPAAVAARSHLVELRLRLGLKPGHYVYSPETDSSWALTYTYTQILESLERYNQSFSAMVLETTEVGFSWSDRWPGGWAGRSEALLTTKFLQTLRDHLVALAAIRRDLDTSRGMSPRTLTDIEGHLTDLARVSHSVANSLIAHSWPQHRCPAEKCNFMGKEVFVQMGALARIALRQVSDRTPLLNLDNFLKPSLQIWLLRFGYDLRSDISQATLNLLVKSLLSDLFQSTQRALPLSSGRGPAPEDQRRGGVSTLIRISLEVVVQGLTLLA